VNLRALSLVGATLAALGLVAGCFSERVAAPGGGQCVAPPDSTLQGSPIIRIVDFEFQPAAACVTPGTTVTWINGGAQIHTTTADLGGWDSPFLNPGASYTVTFAQGGTFAYHCTPHPFMVAKIVVQ